ncbi:MAG: ImmA/IrrE family metallo-endopeptidase [Lachnospiraceae bacterium]|nr:ImmA/IrrE family metallo-endopeptidase [Lachnospiraceae bacterium]
MTEYETLAQELHQSNVEIIDYSFQSPNIKGLLIDNVIGINKNINTSAERTCVLAEEYGHFLTSSGNILDQNVTSNRKQELRARNWAYERMAGLTKILTAYQNKCHTSYEIAEYLGITEEFLQDALLRYRQKYGAFATIDNYVIYFEPSFGVLEIK